MAVGALVPQEVGAVAEGLAAVRALVGLLTRVGALVAKQVRAVSEGLAATGTLVGPLARVGALVHLEVVLDAESLAALGTHEGSRAARSSVRLLVPHQAGLLREGLAAQRTAVWLFLRGVVDDQAAIVPQTLLPVPRRGPAPGGRQLGHGHFRLQSPAPGEAEAQRGVRGPPKSSQPLASGRTLQWPPTASSIRHSAALFKPAGSPCCNALLSLPPLNHILPGPQTFLK